MDLLLLFAIPLLTALACALMQDAKWLGRIQIAGISCMAWASWQLIEKILHHGPYQPTDIAPNLFYLDAFSGLMILIITLVSFFVSLYSNRYMLNDDSSASLNRLKGYYALLNLFIAVMLVVSSVNSLGVFWITIELTTLVSAFLVGFYQKDTAVEAAWKYIILCTVGITFALIGLIITYLATTQVSGPNQFGLDWTYLLTIAPKLHPILMKTAFVFILIGFGTKAGLAPMHAWLPDAHSESPTPVSALLSGVLLKLGLYGIVRFGMLTNLAVGSNFAGHMLLFFGLLSLLVATPFIIVQQNVKRLLAYSSLEHIGIISIGLGFGTPFALLGALFHIINHALVKSSMFFVSGNLSMRYLTKKIPHIHGAIKRTPFSAILMLLGGLALAGSPPFSVFFSEFYILKGGLEGHYWVHSGIFLLLLTLIFGGILYHILTMFMGKAEQDEGNLVASPEGYLIERHASNMWAISIPVVLLVLLPWWMPAPLSELFQQTLAILAHGGWN